MNYIVVYRITILSCFLLLSTGLTAQKPEGDLILTHHQLKHAEAICDTVSVINQPVRQGFFTPSPAVQNQKSSLKAENKKRSQIGSSFDSLFQREESSSSSREQSPAKNSLLNKRYNPLKIILFITALK